MHACSASTVTPSPLYGQSEPGLVSRQMRLSDAIQKQTNSLIDRIDASADDTEARAWLVDLGRELVEQGCGLLDYAGLDVSGVFAAVDGLLEAHSSDGAQETRPDE